MQVCYLGLSPDPLFQSLQLQIIYPSVSLNIHRSSICFKRKIVGHNESRCSCSLWIFVRMNNYREKIMKCFFTRILIWVCWFVTKQVKFCRHFWLIPNFVEIRLISFGVECSQTIRRETSPIFRLITYFFHRTSRNRHTSRIWNTLRVGAQANT
jgi:hypothetical protein